MIEHRKGSHKRSNVSGPEKRLDLKAQTLVKSSTLVPEQQPSKNRQKFKNSKKRNDFQDKENYKVLCDSTFLRQQKNKAVRYHTPRTKILVERGAITDVRATLATCGANRKIREASLCAALIPRIRKISFCVRRKAPCPKRLNDIFASEKALNSKCPS